MSWYDPSTWTGRDFDPTVNPWAAGLYGPMGWGAYLGSQFLPGGRGDAGSLLGLPTAPDLSDQAVILANLERRRRLASLQGRSATFLTGPRGIGPGLPTSEMAQAFLRASVESSFEDFPAGRPGGETPVPGEGPATPGRRVPPRQLPPWIPDRRRLPGRVPRYPAPAPPRGP